MSVEEKMARLRSLGEECKLVDFQLASLRQRRDGLALELVDEGRTWREVADAAGFENPYIAHLKAKGLLPNGDETAA